MKISPLVLTSTAAIGLMASAWLMGGQWQNFIYVSAPLAVIGLALTTACRWREPMEWPMRIAVLLALGWVGYVGLSILNPSHQLVESNGRKFWKTIASIGEFPSTVDPQRTLLFLSWILAAVGLATAVGFTQVSRTWLRRFLMAVVLNAFVLTLVGFYFRLDGTGLALGFIPVQSWESSFFATLLYRNHWGAFALLNAFAALGLFWHTRRVPHTGEDISQERQFGWFWLFAAGVMFLSILFVGSRSATVATLLGAVGLALWTPTAKAKGFWAKCGVRAGRLALLAVAGTAITGITYLVNPQSIQHAIWRTNNDVSVLSGEDESLRFLPFDDTWRMIEARPIFGHGLGSYKHINVAYAGPEYLVLTPDGVLLRGLEYAHLDWMQYLSELGVVGMTLVLVPLGIAVWQLRRGRGNPISAALLAGSGAIVVMAIFELPLSNPSIFMHTMVFASVGIRYAIAQQTAHEELQAVRNRHYRHEGHRPRHLRPVGAQTTPSLN